MKGIVVSIPGVQEVEVRYEDRSLDVTFDGEKTSEEEIIKKVGQGMGLAMEVAEARGAKKEGDVSETCPM
jgi:copper chaperone CopZ